MKVKQGKTGVFQSLTLSACEMTHSTAWSCDCESQVHSKSPSAEMRKEATAEWCLPWNSAHRLQYSWLQLFFPYTSAEILEEANFQFHESGCHAFFPPHKCISWSACLELEQRPHSQWGICHRQTFQSALSCSCRQSKPNKKMNL